MCKRSFAAVLVVVDMSLTLHHIYSRIQPSPAQEMKKLKDLTNVRASGPQGTPCFSVPLTSAACLDQFYFVCLQGSFVHSAF